MLAAKADQYATSHQIRLNRVMGSGKDGTVWHSSRPSALKIHALETSYRIERNAYMRLGDLGVFEIAGFSVPAMREHDDDLLAIEMSIVMPPYLVDFASAIFDIEPDFIEDDGHTFEDFIRHRFDDRAGGRCLTFITNWRPARGFICRTCIRRM